MRSVNCSAQHFHRALSRQFLDANCIHSVLLIRPISDFDTLCFNSMIAEKTSTPVLTTRYVPATIVLTITSAAMGKTSSIEGSDGDSLSEKIPEATWL
jgi:hypothetical protein